MSNCPTPQKTVPMISRESNSSQLSHLNWSTADLAPAIGRQ
jgi:hypothetical protein